MGKDSLDNRYLDRLNDLDDDLGDLDEDLEKYVELDPDNIDYMQVTKNVAHAIKTMEIRGAGRIAQSAVSTLVDFASNYKTENLNQFVIDIFKAKRILLKSRPTAVSLYNGVNAALRDVRSSASFYEARNSVISNGTRFITDCESALLDIARYGSQLIEDGDVILTHCNSTAAIDVIIEAARNKNIKVYATETRPWRQGLLTVTALGKQNIDTTLIVDSAVRTVMKKVDKVFVGADTITSSGHLINKVGTSQIALCAHEARKQFNVCAETYKFSPKTLFGEQVPIEERSRSEIVGEGDVPDSVKVFNPVFDITPPEYIDNIITEIGIMSPGAVYGVIADKMHKRINTSNIWGD